MTCRSSGTSICVFLRPYFTRWFSTVVDGDYIVRISRSKPSSSVVHSYSADWGKSGTPSWCHTPCVVINHHTIDFFSSSQIGRNIWAPNSFVVKSIPLNSPILVMLVPGSYSWHTHTSTSIAFTVFHVKILEAPKSANADAHLCSPRYFAFWKPFQFYQHHWTHERLVRRTSSCPDTNKIDNLPCLYIIGYIDEWQVPVHRCLVI